MNIKVLREKALGIFDYYRYPKRKNSWGGPFNGQLFRQQIFSELIEKIDFSAIVETGTFRGTTTEHLQKISRLPVYTVEVNPRSHEFAKWRFRKNRNITICWGDSRPFLRSLFEDSTFARKRIFYYLDAHWADDLPLREEIQLIFNNCPGAVVMIDDFQVPGDDGYGYDEYGDDKTVDLEYIGPLYAELKFQAFFPSKRAEFETGKKRGCVVLATAPELIGELREVDALIPFAHDFT